MKHSLKKLLALGFAVIMLFTAAACAKGKASPKLEHSITHFYSKETNMTSFYMDGKLLEDQIGGGITRLGTVDGTKGFILAATALYYIDESGILKLYPAAVSNAVLSLDGRFILFATAQKVFLYDHEVREYSEIGGIEAKSIVSLVLSPDGGKAGITVVDKENSINAYTFTSGNENAELFGSGRLIAGISDGGAVLYWLEAADGVLSGKLHCIKNGSDSLIAENASNYFELNSSLNEITFDVDGKTNISRNGGKAVQLVDGSVFSKAGAQYASQGGSACTTLLKNADTLLNSVFYSEITSQDTSGTTYQQYNVYYINSSLNATRLVGGATQFAVSDEGKDVICIVDDVLYRVSAYNPKKPEKIAESIYSFTAKGDLETIYIIDLNGSLYEYKNGLIGNVLITGVQLAKLMNNGTVICYAPSESSGTLLWLSDGRSNAIQDNVSFFEVYGDFAVCLANYDKTDNTYDLFTSNDGKDFSLALERVEIGR